VQGIESSGDVDAPARCSEQGGFRAETSGLSREMGCFRAETQVPSRILGCFRAETAGECGGGAEAPPRDTETLEVFPSWDFRKTPT
jgi:hypothetical protein